jgi:hypothetical protein
MAADGFESVARPLRVLPPVRPRRRDLSPTAALGKEAAIGMAGSTARKALAGIDGRLDRSMAVSRAVL